MSAQHTPGRLIVRGGYSIYTADGTPVADTCLTATIPDNDEANARRLVACWNACEKVSTEDLEAMKRTADVSWVMTIDMLVRQRDELLEALREMTERIEGHPAYEAMTEEEENLTGGDTAELSYLARVGRAAIAKAEGQ